MTRNGMYRFAAGALVGIAGLASAQDVDVVVTRTITVGNDRLEIVFRDGERSVTLNGEPIDAAQLTTSERDGSWILRGEDGIEVLRLPASAARAMLEDRERRQSVTLRQRGLGEAEPETAGAETRPPVRLGVVMRAPTTDERRLMGLASRPGVLIERVIEGSPAERAGLERFDAIKVLDGEDEVSIDRVREILAGKRPGDEVEVVVLRDGRERTFEVELGDPEPDDADAGAEALRGLTFDPFGDDGVRLQLRLRGEDMNELGRELRDRVLTAVESMLDDMDLERSSVDELMKQMDAMLRERLEEPLRDAFGGQGRVRAFRFEPGQDRLWIDPDLEGTLRALRDIDPRRLGLQPPAVPTPPALPQDLDRRLDEMAERMNRRLDRLEERLERVLNRLEGDRPVPGNRGEPRRRGGENPRDGERPST